jgi:hypothetical protein
MLYVVFQSKKSTYLPAFMHYYHLVAATCIAESRTQETNLTRVLGGHHSLENCFRKEAAKYPMIS